MGWTVYLSVYKNLNSSVDEKVLKEKVISICQKQIRVPGSEPLSELRSESLKKYFEPPSPDHDLIQMFFSKIQSSWNPFLSIFLIMLTGKRIRRKFSKDLKVTISDDFGLPFLDIEKRTAPFLLLWALIAILLTPLWLIFLFIQNLRGR